MSGDHGTRIARARMVRIQACVQVWPAAKEIKVGTMTPAAPISDFKLECHSSQENLCLSSSELLFTYLGRALAKLFHLAIGTDPIIRSDTCTKLMAR
jgi:hypothetical protein